jgi:hypothetical protein
MQKQEYIEKLCAGAQVERSELALWDLPHGRLSGYGCVVPHTEHSARITTSDYTQANLDAAIAHLRTVRDGQREVLAAYWETPAGIAEQARIGAEILRRTETKRIHSLAESAGLVRGEHGSDYHTLTVESTATPQDVADYQTVHLVYLIEDARERTYSKAYTRRFGTGNRTDLYLLGTNEVTGTAWIRAVPGSCGTVRDALEWTWGVSRLLYRQGDVALCECDRQPKTGWALGSVEVAPSHVVTGEIAHRGSTVYARKGELVHRKNQHAAIVFSDCRRVVVAKTYEKPRTRTSSD